MLATVSSPLATRLGEFHANKKVDVITCGFDPDEAGSTNLTDKFTITYTGNIYPGKQDPEIFFKAITELIADGDIDRDDIEIRFYGSELGWVQQQISAYNLADIAKQHGFISYRLSLVKQKESQVLLLLDWMDREEHGIYTGKIFDYLADSKSL